MSASEFIISSYKMLFDVEESEILTIGRDVAFPLFAETILVDLCKEAIEKLAKQPMVVHIESPVCIVGDIHGSIHDLLRILKKGDPFDYQYLFLGDYVDRGQFSIEVITLLLAFYCQGAKVTLLRGNHEISEICSAYGFKKEIETVYQSTDLFNDFNCVFEYLPLAAIIDDSYFCVHGGISQHMSIKDIENIERPLENDKDPLVHGLLWNDPSERFADFADSMRGRCFTFGIEAVKNFLEKENLKAIVRAHQYTPDGIKANLQNTCITVFSASSYKSNGSNKSAVLNVDGTHNTMTVYDALPRLIRNDAQFFTMHRQSLFPRSGSITLQCSRSPSGLFAIKNKSLSKFHVGSGNYQNKMVINHISRNSFDRPLMKNKTTNELLSNFKKNAKLIPTFLEDE